MSDMIREQFDRLVKKAKSVGAQVELLVNGGDSLKLSFQNRKLDSYTSSSHQIAGWRVILGARQGYSFTENFSPEALERAFDDALANAHVGEDTGAEVSLPRPGSLTDEMKDLFAPEEVSVEKKMEVARALEEKTLETDSRVARVPYSGYVDGLSWIRVLNSEGLDREFRRTWYSGHAYALAKQGEQNKMWGDGFYTRGFAEIDVSSVTKRAAEGAVRLLGATPPKTGRYVVLMDRDVVQKMLGLFVDAMSSKSVLENTSPLKGKKGERIAAAQVQITDDPFDRRAMGCRPFDAEGVCARKTILVKDGVLQTYLTNSITARKMGQENTGHAARGPGSELDVSASNIVMALGTKSRDELMRAAPKILWVKDVSGLHSGYKEASGDFSLPLEGLMIENGEITGACDQCVMSGNLFQLFQKIQDIGDDYGPIRGPVLAPDLLIEELSIAGA